MKKESVTFLIPAYNEEKAIADTLKKIKEVGQKENLDFEVIVIDDGSKDKTGEIAKENGAIVLTHPENSGYGLSIQHGIEKSSKELIALTDADGTYPINEISKLLRMVDKGFDMAVGARSGSEFKKGLWKYPARIAFKWLSEFVAGRKIPDINSGLRVMRKDKLLPHYKRTCFGFSFTTSITLIFFLNGYSVGYTPIPYEKRIGKSKVKHFRDTLRTAQIIVSVISYYNPIKLFLLVSLLSGIFSVILIILGYLTNFYIISNLGVFILGTTPLIMSLGFLAESFRLKQ